MTEQTTFIQEATCWSDERWTARVIKNEDDDGWAVSMTRQGDSEPALVGPWTMGRDKKNPKPLDAPAFHTLVKTAAEVLRRHEQQLHAQLNKSVSVGTGSKRIRVSLQIVPDEDNPHALLRAHDELGAQLGEVRVAPGLKLNADSAAVWIEGGFQKP
ncbi:hypothetical protein H4CHR_00173 [Variovorax sp. PBS-H4]|uniref:hypothetical protein n=1 Tax=Variovorax sp. PBS-H4 TaxID=434008 RepID=UPI0013175A83|nr:hypothetical protein [Variovorax sp. PBS-H4]VTU18378.1 hypothetical protein H4CHR_00173 [Variovorax sp. PBS-H4]